MKSIITDKYRMDIDTNPIVRVEAVKPLTEYIEINIYNINYDDIVIGHSIRVTVGNGLFNSPYYYGNHYNDNR